MSDRQHSYKVPLSQTGSWRYEIWKGDALIKVSDPHGSRELAVANGHAEACELDGIFD